MGIRLENLVGLIAIFEANENNFIYLSFKDLISAFNPNSFDIHLLHWHTSEGRLSFINMELRHEAFLPRLHPALQTTLLLLTCSSVTR